MRAIKKKLESWRSSKSWKEIKKNVKHKNEIQNDQQNLISSALVYKIAQWDVQNLSHPGLSSSIVTQRQVTIQRISVFSCALAYLKTWLVCDQKYVRDKLLSITGMLVSS